MDEKPICLNCGAIIPATESGNGSYGFCEPCLKNIEELTRNEKEQDSPEINSLVPCLTPPQYDIDALLNVDRTVPGTAWSVVCAIADAANAIPKPDERTYYRPDSALFFPEVIARDFIWFNVTMGNGWSTSLGYSGGLTLFFRGLRALRTIGHALGIAMAEAVLTALKEHGIPELTTFADEPLYGRCEDWDMDALRKYDWDVEQSLNRQFGQYGLNLDSQWWDVSHSYWSNRKGFVPDDPPVEYTLCEYLDRNRDLLRRRKPGHGA